MKRAKRSGKKKLPISQIGEFFISRISRGLCQFYTSIERRGIISKKELKFLLSEIRADLRKFNKYAFLFDSFLYYPRLDYLTQKVKFYEEYI